MKTCFKCERRLPLSEYYGHPRMADGHLNKCKDCTKADTVARVAVKSKDPVWLEAEIERQRLKQQRSRANGTAAVLTKEAKRLVQIRHRRKYPQKSSARQKTQRAITSGEIIRKPCEVCGNPDSEAHHEDYSQPKWVALPKTPRPKA